MTEEVRRAESVLANTPSTLRALLADLSPELVDANEGPGSFTPRDVVAHLVHGEEEDWMVRARTILEHGEARAFEPFDPLGFRTRYPGLSLAELLDRFDDLRGRNLASLTALALTDEDLARAGTHPAFGRVTLGELLATWVVHDLAHLAQAIRVIAKSMRDDVGPWRAYLSILDR